MKYGSLIRALNDFKMHIKCIIILTSYLVSIFAINTGRRVAIDGGAIKYERRRLL